MEPFWSAFITRAPMLRLAPDVWWKWLLIVSDRLDRFRWHLKTSAASADVSFGVFICNVVWDNKRYHLRWTCCRRFVWMNLPCIYTEQTQHNTMMNRYNDLIYAQLSHWFGVQCCSISNVNRELYDQVNSQPICSFIYLIIHEICNKNSYKRQWSKRCTLYDSHRV